MERIQIEGYKSIRHLDLELRDINILIGSNGSGKTNFVSFFEFLQCIMARSLHEYVSLRGGIDRFLFEGRQVSQEISARLYFLHNGYSFQLKAGEEELIFTKEGLWYDGNPFMSNPKEIATLKNESNLQFCTIPRANYIQEFLSQLKRYHFHDTSSKSPFTATSNVQNDIYSLYGSGENLAALLYSIKERNIKSYHLIVKTIQSIAPYFRDFVLNPTPSGDIRLQWQSKYESTIYGVPTFSDGTIRFVALAVLFLQPDLPQTIIIDEPELGLHPYAISKLSGLIKSAAARGCQIIIATQSTELISYFEPEDIVTVDQVSGESRFARLSSSELAEWIDGYSIGELWKLNIIAQGQPNR